MLAVTTRKPDADPGMLFSGERGNAIALENIVVSIPPDQGRKIGEIQWPTKLPGDPAKNFVTLRAEKFAANHQVLDWLKRNRGPKKRVLVFVHGFNNTYADAVYRFAQIAHDAKIDAAPVLFTWPSRASVFDYNYDKESTNYSRAALEGILREAASSPDVGDITILAHSMGGWLTMEALRDLALGNKQIPAKIHNVILASPDIDIDVFRRQLVEIGPKRPQFTIISSRGDRALALSRWISGDVDRVGATDLRPYADALRALGITVIDTSDAKANDPLRHNTFTESPEMVQLLGQRLSGQSLETNDISLGDGVGITVFGALRVVDTAARTAVAAPISIISPATRRRLTQELEGDDGTKTLSGPTDIAY